MHEEHDIKALDEKIRIARQGRTTEGAASAQLTQKLKDKAALNAGMEFSVAIGVGGFLGYWLDHNLNTMPLFFILMFLAGALAGFFSLYKASLNLGGAVGFSQLHANQKKAKHAPENVAPPDTLEQ